LAATFFKLLIIFCKLMILLSTWTWICRKYHLFSKIQAILCGHFCHYFYFSFNIVMN
jgi:hypothetical protein